MLKVEGNLTDITKNQLKFCFQNRRAQGGGPVDDIKIAADKKSAVIVFKETTAVDFILSKGNTVSHSGALLQLKPYYTKTKLTDAKYRYTDEAAVGPDLRNAQDRRKLKAENIAVESQNKNQRKKEKDEAYNFNTNQKEFPPTAKKVEKGNYPKDVLRSAKIDLHLDEEESDLSPCNCTVKIRLGSIKESIDVYIFYLEDPAVNTGEFIEDSLMLDGINKVVYVTFCSPHEARDFCELPHTESDMDILNVEMATEEDFRTYPNYIFLRGKLNGADELADFIHENFHLEILDILHEDDSDSYIVIFDPETCTDITPLTWELTSLSGNKMITAPVTIQNCVLLYGLTTSISSQTLQRYLENKRRSGGGKVKSLERMSDEQAIICFEDEVDLDVLLSKDHKIENSELSLRRYFPCLSENYMNKDDFENEMTKAEHTPSRSIHKEKNPGHHSKMNTTYSRLLKEDCVQQEKECNKLFLSGKSYGKTVSCGDISKLKTKKKTFQLKEEVSLERFEIILLEKCKFFDQINDRHKEINLNLDYNANKVILNGDDKRQLEDIHRGSLSKCRQDVDFCKLDNMTADQIKFLKKDNVQKKVDSMLDNCYMQCNEIDVKLYYLKSESLNIKDAEKIIRSQAEVHTKPMNQDMLNMLQSSDGSRFMSSLIDDNSSLSTIIKLDSQSKTLSIIASGDQLYQVVQEIETYLKTNKLHKVEIHLSEGKHRFLKKFLMDDFSTFKSSIGNDALIEFSSDKCVIKGVKDVVERCEGFIKNILAKIVGNNVTLKFFGIKEFLHDSEGKTLIKSIEEEHRCIILFKSEVNKTSKPKVAVKTPTLIAKCSINGVNISFFQGNILELNVDVLVNPLDPSQQFVSAMSKELIQLGGQNIKKDFMRSCTSSSVGSVTETSSGSLSNINRILHLVCPVYCDDQKVKELESTVRACLHYAANKNYSSISLPAVGLGKILKFSLTSVCKNMVNVVKDFIETGRNSFREIYFCDMKAASIRTMMESFENKFNDIQFETETMLADKRDFKFNSQSPHKSLSKKGWDFKSIKVNVALGEINKQDTDIIVITVDKSLELTKGRLSKIILDEAGDRIQEELRNKYNNGIKAGDFAMSSGGNLPCQHIFYACLSRNRGDNGQMEDLVYKLLEQAIKLQATSISIPALGTGNLCYSSDNSAQVIIETIEKFASRNSSSDLKVNIVVLPKDQEIAKKITPKK
uniref:Macro domain-containing protein n=1 Tax=Biomphalaria glabrata TaxID=6526 RepID=A0A2C9L0B8_BIOGL